MTNDVPGYSDASETPPSVTSHVAEASEFDSISDAELAELTAAAPPSAAIPQPGTELRGHVIEGSGDCVFVDVGLRSQAIVPSEQFGDATPLAGAQVDIVIDRFDEASDLLHAHKKGAVVTITELKNMTPGTLIEGNVSGMVKGGLEVQFGSSLRAFMPASHADIARLKDISTLLGERIKCEVLEVDPSGKSVIVSRRNAQQKELEAKQEELLTELEVGQDRKGRVVNLTDYGAFVDIGGVHGLIHISDLSWAPVSKVEDVVKPGDEITVRVLKINKERNRISLGLKQATPDPWDHVEELFPVGTQVKARVVKIAEFGAFAEIADGVQALIPLSEMSWNHRPAKANEIVQEGQMVDVKVISVDRKRRRIGLSVRQMSEDPWSSIATAYPPDTILEGKVTKILDFGVLVELHAGIEGMVHISEMSEQRVRTPGDVVKTGESVRVKVLSVDPKKRKIALSIKATLAPTTDASPTETASHKTARSKKKKLRGGLDSHFDWSVGGL